MQTIQKALLTALLMLLAVLAPAQDHAHGAHHHGVVKTAGDYHLEMVKTGPKISVYLLDSREATLPLGGISGQIILQLADHTTVTKKLVPVGDHLEISLAKEQSFNAIVSLKVKGKTITARFAQPAPAHDHTTPASTH